jgi:formylglycine-generating enzyme required for sulfatase activity
MEFCNKLNQKFADILPQGYKFSLPTEAQWEYACRAGTTTALNNGRDLDKVGWYEKNSGRSTHPVGKKKPNAWGFYDMHGNVCEWCRDWYEYSYNGDETDPKGPSSGSDRVYRGGSWFNIAGRCRAANRNRDSPSIRYFNLGFRLAIAPVQ